MNLHNECAVRNPSSKQPGIVWSKRSLTTQCANPQCFKELLYLREGRLELLQLEPHVGDQPLPDDGAFAMRPLPSKCFWLCGECAITYIVKRWTPSGLVVLLRNQNPADSHPDLPARPANAGPTRPLPALQTVLPMRIDRAAAAPSATLASAAEKDSWPKARQPPQTLSITGCERRGQTVRPPFMPAEATNGIIAHLRRLPLDSRSG
jgi:hypothetical protein